MWVVAGESRDSHEVTQDLSKAFATTQKVGTGRIISGIKLALLKEQKRMIPEILSASVDRHRRSEDL